MKLFNHLLLLVISVCNVALSQVSVLPNHENILYTGRFSFDDPVNPSFSMNGASIKIAFEGTKVEGRFSTEGGASFVYLIVDGNAAPYNRTLIEIQGINEAIFSLTADLDPGPHTLELVKLNESDAKLYFHGFIIAGTGLLNRPERPALQLEFIGDSNTAGWSAWNAYDQGGIDASGAYFTFPGITARMLNAEYSLIGGSGSGISDKAPWNLTDYYDRIHIGDQASALNQWNFEENYWNFDPAAVVVNLGANDYSSGATKQEIKDSWKDFIRNRLRIHYPNAHIVLANSYGWAYGEPADYVQEAVEELKAAGEINVSFIRFPWLWGQQHAVINEHAGFANVLALHLATVLNLPAPEPSDWSSFVEKGALYNGGFEKSILPGVADGWRPNGKNERISNAEEALDSNCFIRLENGARIHYPTQVDTGMNLQLSGWVKAQNDSHSGFLKIEFKDQGQNTIKTQQIQPDFTTEWKKYEMLAEVPEGVWSAWIVLEATDNAVVDFDHFSLEVLDSNEENTPPEEPETTIGLYPNPVKDFLNINLNSEEHTDYWVYIYSLNGILLEQQKNIEQIDLRSYQSAVYILQIPQRDYLTKFLKW